MMDLIKNEFAHLLGIHANIENDAYHASPGISKSGLDQIARAPEIYYGRSLDPDRPPRTEKPGQLEGTLLHCAALEPDQFSSRYIVGPNVNRSTKAWKNFAAENLGKQAIKPGQYDACMRQADSLRRLGVIRELEGMPHINESSAYWIDEQTGVLCRCRPDSAADAGSGNILLDLKTYSSADPGEFARQSARKRYHVQDAFYSDGYEIASGVETLAFVFAAVETEWPYAAAAIQLGLTSQDRGRELYENDLATYSDCLESGVWDGYVRDGEIAVVELPPWALRD